ncbi:DUF2867 domain-containing protein [Pseudomonas asiatica]|uniref:DUF2867 domain-containing protein n=1 Tax=Pseudomonas asiatica TaxID=2219225 RepID=UPI00399C0055
MNFAAKPTSSTACSICIETHVGLLRGPSRHKPFRIRDVISRRFNVAEIQGFSLCSPESVREVGERLDFFTVEDISDQQLVLTSRDTHLAVMVCMDVSTGECGFPQLNVTTSVKCFNTFGRLYMVPVGWVHGVIVRRMLSNLQGHRFERR